MARPNPQNRPMKRKSVSPVVAVIALVVLVVALVFVWKMVSKPQSGVKMTPSLAKIGDEWAKDPVMQKIRESRRGQRGMQRSASGPRMEREGQSTGK